MISLQKLKQIAKDGLAILKKDKSLIEGTVYASANRRVIGRLVYTHHFPCQGLEEPKSDDDFGVSVQGRFKTGSKRLVGFGQVSNDLSSDAVRRALERARANAIADPDFHGFPEAVKEKPAPRAFVDPKLRDLSPEKEARLLADFSFRTLEGAFRVFRKHHKKSEMENPDFIVSGDNFFVTERMALRSTTGVAVSDESTILMSLVSAMVERAHAKGRGWGATGTLKGFKPEEAGREAADQAWRGTGGIRIKSGNYDVVFGPQAVSEIFASLLLSSFSAGSIDFGLSLFNGQFGSEIASPLLDMHDDPTLRCAAGSKTFGDEGYRTKRTAIVERGQFRGILQNDYCRKKLLARDDKALAEKLGPGGREYLRSDVARSGFRFGGGGGRIAAFEPGISATNLVIGSHAPVPRQKLFREIKNGVYIGALWYTYPIAGYKAGEISGTAVADTFLIENGKIGRPLKVNSLRIRANLRDLVKNIIGITPDTRPTILWASDEITYAPEIGISDVHLEAIEHDA